jgi:hypothetical protein
MMTVTFNHDFTISDIIAGLTFVSVVVAGLFALMKWNTYLKLKRAEYVKSLLGEMKSNKDIVFYLFDYNQVWYDLNFHNSGEFERMVDYTLNHFSYICYLYNHKIIDKSDFMCFKYDIERVLHNNQVQEYFYNLYHFSIKIKQPFPFYELFEYAKKHHYMDDEFWNKKSKRYNHYLNF